ncbi:MAG: LysE family transporter [Candidatus Aminicenantes bacterium]|nr:LysE family transporter [Candidatus Aminicenantes bacterium]
MLTFFQGMLVAMPLILGVGPGLIAQVEMGLRHGFKACAAVVYGLYSCALVVVVISYLGFVRFLNAPGLRLAIAMFNGLLIITWGIVKTIRSHKKIFREAPPRENLRIRLPRLPLPLSCYLRGFVLNLTNPIGLFFWLNILSLAHLNLKIEDQNLPLFIVGLFTAGVSMDMAKCVFFSRSGNLLKPRVMMLVNRAMGLLLIVLGAYLIVSAL